MAEGKTSGGAAYEKRNRVRIGSKKKFKEVAKKGYGGDRCVVGEAQNCPNRKGPQSDRERLDPRSRTVNWEERAEGRGLDEALVGLGKPKGSGVLQEKRSICGK